MHQSTKDISSKFLGAISALGNSVRQLFVKEEPDVDPIQKTVSSRDGFLDAYSDTWIFVSNWAGAELTRLRESNDSTKLDEIQTAVIRGRIRALKDLVSLPAAKDRKSRRESIQDDPDY